MKLVTKFEVNSTLTVDKKVPTQIFEILGLFPFSETSDACQMSPEYKPIYRFKTGVKYQ